MSVAVTDPVIASVTAPLALARIKAATRAEHEALDAALDLMSPALDAAGYRRRLELFFGYYAPLEAALAASTHWARHGIDWAARLKTGWLQSDLHALGIDPAGLPHCAALPRLDSLAAGFGCLYVIEGATLGGQLISRHLLRQFGYDSRHGAVFFNGYQHRTAEMWKSFRSAFAAHVDEAGEARAEAAAIATFAGLRHWCSQDSAA